MILSDRKKFLAATYGKQVEHVGVYMIMVEVFNTAIKYHSRTHINSNKLICSLSLYLKSSCFISISGDVQRFQVHFRPERNVPHWIDNKDDKRMVGLVNISLN